MGYRDLLAGRGDVHVWFVELTADIDTVEACTHCLSEEEKVRASRFRMEHLSTDFVLSHGALRALLGCYLDTSPERIVFAQGPRGKPRVSYPGAELKFNMAHAGRFAAYALGVDCEVGIDIEAIRPMPDQESVVRRFFSREECEDWLAFDIAERNEAFFRCWTRKEAFIKALGEGLSKPLDSFRVSLLPEAPAASVYVAGDPAATAKWSLHSLVPAEGYVAALAVPMPQCHVSIFPRLTATDLLNSTAGPGAFPPPAESL